MQVKYRLNMKELASLDKREITILFYMYIPLNTVSHSMEGEFCPKSNNVVTKFFKAS